MRGLWTVFKQVYFLLAIFKWLFQDRKSEVFLTNCGELALNHCSKSYFEVCVEVKLQNPQRKKKSTINKLLVMLCSVSAIRSFCRTCDSLISLSTIGTKGVFASCHRGVAIEMYGATPIINLFLRVSHAVATWEGLFICGNVVTSTVNQSGQGQQLLSVPCLYVILIQCCIVKSSRTEFNRFMNCSVKKVRDKSR